ncbi:hypothetical protein [Streptomyces sp. NPDC003077]|uniref:hypothetical protein n=1 Tax=Streptomyces sp. NPDC003077 TaxID=3154443 RepID=UPI0033B2BB56
MGLTVLYIAFGFVALWLLGEVLLQYKAPLHWRLLAFAGFLTVVAGVASSLVAVIVAGALVFAVGQTYVTLSVRRGVAVGWALGGKPGESRRRKGGRGGAPGRSARRVTAPTGPDPSQAAGAPAPVGGPTGVPASGPAGAPASDLEATAAFPAVSDAPDAAPPYAPPVPEGAAGHGGPGAMDDATRVADYAAAFDGYGGPDQPAAGQAPYAGYYGADAAPPAQQDPLSASPTPAAPQQGAPYAPYEQFDAYGQPSPSPFPPQQYGGEQGQVYGDVFGAGHPTGTSHGAAPGGRDEFADTPPGGIWVPPQRHGDFPPQPPYDSRQGYDGQRY